MQKIKNNVLKISQSDYFPFVVLALLLLFFHACINVGWADDEYFSKVLVVNNINYISNPQSLCHTSNVDKHSKSHAKNVNYVYEDWTKNGYFSNDIAKINFLKWASNMNYWQDNYEIDKMFLESIGQELLKDEVLDLLPKDYKVAYEKMKNKVYNQSK